MDNRHNTEQAALYGVFAVTTGGPGKGHWRICNELGVKHLFTAALNMWKRLWVSRCQSDLGTPGFGDPYPRIPSDMGARSPTFLVILGLPGGPTALEVWGPCVVM